MTFARDELNRLWCGKVNYPSADAAMRACRAINGRAGGEATAYYCVTCQAFHFGRKGTRTEIKAEKSRINDEDTIMLTTVEKHKAAAAPRIQSAVNEAAQANRELSWLAQRVAKGREGVFSEIATITPGIARHLLEQNASNRNVRQRLVDRIATDISNGFWDLNGEAIIVAKSGELNDGQHRLCAVVQAGQSIETNIIFGVDRNSRFTVDMGAARTAGDFLGMQGAKYKSHAAAASKLLVMFRLGFNFVGGYQASRLSTQPILAEYWENEKAVNAACQCVLADKFLATYGGAALIAAHVILTRANFEQSSVFFTKLETGDQLARGDAILALRQRMIDMRSERFQPIEKLEVFIRYWNAWRQGAKVQRALSVRHSWPEVSK